jgi:hypothetical protein
MFAFIWPSSIHPSIHPFLPSFKWNNSHQSFYYNNKGPYKRPQAPKIQWSDLDLAFIYNCLKLQIQWSDLDLAFIYNCIQYSHFLHLKEVPSNWMSSLRPRQSNESNFWLVVLTSPPSPSPTTPCLRGWNYIHNKGIGSVNWFEDPKMSRPHFMLVNSHQSCWQAFVKF